jgi:hypothetical protein
LVSVGVIVIDNIKIRSSATMDQNRDYREIASEILAEAEEIDRREDELSGDRRGDGLPEQLRTPQGRRQAPAEANRRIQERNGRAMTGERTRQTSSQMSLPRPSAVGVSGYARAAANRNASARQNGGRSPMTGLIGCLKPSGAGAQRGRGHRGASCL